MKTTQIEILNLSCKGCVNTITKSLLAISGVESVSVDLATNIVKIVHREELEREVFTKKLFSLGYPEVSESNNFISKLKSKKSCMIGRIV
jgi:copper chaperone CopZ